MVFCSLASRLRKIIEFNVSVIVSCKPQFLHFNIISVFRVFSLFISVGTTCPTRASLHDVILPESPQPSRDADSRLSHSNETFSSLWLSRLPARCQTKSASTSLSELFGSKQRHPGEKDGSVVSFDQETVAAVLFIYHAIRFGLFSSCDVVPSWSSQYLQLRDFAPAVEPNVNS
jgi:hypothetical protein